MNKNILMKQLQLLIEKNTSMCELQFWYRRYCKWCYAYWKDVKSGLRYFCIWNNFLIFSTKYMLGNLFKFQCNTVIAAPWIGKTFAKFLVLLRPCIFVSNILMKTVLFFCQMHIMWIDPKDAKILQKFVLIAISKTSSKNQKSNKVVVVIQSIHRSLEKSIDSHWLMMSHFSYSVFSCVYCFLLKRWNYIKRFVLHEEAVPLPKFFSNRLTS